MIIETKVYSCRKFRSEDLVKNGTNASGSSQYHCKACGTSGVLERKERATEEKKGLTIKVYQERSDMRGIGRTFGVSRRTLSAWLKEQANDLPPLEETLQPVECKKIPVLEVDELLNYCRLLARYHFKNHHYRLRECEEVSLVIRRLPLGDYLIDEVLLIERKTLPDLVASIRDGRLFRQAHWLATSPLRKALILEGTTADLAGSRMRREAVQGALIGLTLYLGVPLLRSRDAAEMVQLMLFAARQGRVAAAGTVPRSGHHPRSKARIQSHILQGLPGVGPQRARCLLETFGSLEEVIQADAEALVSVRGIGGVTAETIRWAVEETTPAYGNSDEVIFSLVMR